MARSFTDFSVVATNGTTFTNTTPAAGSTFTVSAATNWPTANFTVVIDTEIILVSSRSGTTCTIGTAGRGFSNSTAAAHTTSALVEPQAVSQDYNDTNTHVNASSAVHGITGNVVGHNDTQTLTNKTFAAASNTFTQPSCGLYLNVAATTGTGWNKTAFGSGTEEWRAPTTMHDTVTNNSRITFPTAGIAFIVWRYNLESSVQTGAQIRFNGAAAPTNSNGRYGAGSAAGSSWVTPSSGADQFLVAANDYVEMYTANSTSSTATAHFRLAATMLSS